MSDKPHSDDKSNSAAPSEKFRGWSLGVGGIAASVLAVVACTSLAPSVKTAPGPSARPSRGASNAAVAGHSQEGEAHSQAATLSETLTGELPAGAIGHIEDYGSGHSLEALFSTWASLRKSPPEGRGLLLMLGDSHTAGDALTSHLRHRLQREFGDAGRGYLLPGKPVHHYYQKDAEYGSRGSWLVEKGLKREAVEPLGMAGMRIHSASPDAEATVGTCAKCKSGKSVSRFEISYHPQTEGGSIAYRVDEGQWLKLPTRPPAAVAGNNLDIKKLERTSLGTENLDAKKDESERLDQEKLDDRAASDKLPTAYQEVRVADGPHQLSLRPAGDGPIDLFGVALERDVPGMIVDSVGYVGARAYHLHKWDWDYVGPQIGHRNPSLVVLQYGTNETDERELDLPRLEEYFVDLVHRVRAAAPSASILILGPPDRAMRERHDCDPRSSKMAKAKSAPGKRGKSGKSSAQDKIQAALATTANAAATLPGCEWKTPSVLIAIINAERRAAERTHVAFFDLYAALGGQDQMETWVKAEPPIAYKDRTHLTGIGYERAADLFLAALYSAYDAWAAAARATPPPSSPPDPRPAAADASTAVDAGLRD